MEDIKLCSKLKKVSKPLISKIYIKTSARKWEKNGFGKKREKNGFGPAKNGIKTVLAKNGKTICEKREKNGTRQKTET